MKNPVLTGYLSFISDVDALCSRVRALHGGKILCREGCADCCMGIGVFPVEWYALRTSLSAMRKRGVPVRIDPRADCVFLVDGACTVYASRPLICRAHGMPLSYRVEEYGGEGRLVEDGMKERELVLCDLNFTGIGDDERAHYFSAENTVDMEVLNERLVVLNRRFLETREGEPFRKHARLPLSTAAAGLVS